MKEQIRLIERIIRSAFPQFTKPQQKVMSQLITALTQTENFTLRDIASHFLGETDVKHKLKKLQYFLDGLDLNKEFWASYITLILGLPNLRLSKRDKITITVSSSNLGSSFRLLSACISYKNKPLPLYLKLWDSYELPPSFDNDVDVMIKSLKGLLPEKYNYLFISNFNTLIYNFVDEYILRIRPEKLRLKDAIDYTDIKEFPDGVYQGASTDEFKTYINTNIAVLSMPGEDESRSSMYFASSLTNKNDILNYYSRRLLYEEDLIFLINKLKWNKYSKKTPDKSRFEKLLIVSCLAYALNSTDEKDIGKYLQHITVNLTRMK